MNIEAAQLEAFAQNAPVEMARFCIENLSRMEPDHALAALDRARIALAHGQRAPEDPTVSVRVELSRALYCEYASRQMDAAASYDLILSWLHAYGQPVSAAHVDALISAFSWAVLNEQYDWLSRLLPHLEWVVESGPGSEEERRAWRESLSFWMAHVHRNDVELVSLPVDERAKTYALLGEPTGELRELTVGLEARGWKPGEGEDSVVLLRNEQAPEEQRPGIRVRLLDEPFPSALREGADRVDILYLPRTGPERLLADVEVVQSRRTSAQVDYGRLGILRRRFGYTLESIEHCFAAMSGWTHGGVEAWSERESLRSLGAFALALGYMEPCVAARTMLESGAADRIQLHQALETAHVIARRQFGKELSVAG